MNDSVVDYGSGRITDVGTSEWEDTSGWEIQGRTER